MKGFSNFMIAPFFILLFTCHASLNNMNKNAALIDKACKGTEENDLCLSILRGDPRSATADLGGLTIIVLEYTIAKAKATIELVNKMATNTTDPSLKVCFIGCADDYGRFIEYCKASISDVKDKSYQGALDSLDYAAESESTCEECFSERVPPRKSPISDLNEFNHRLLHIAGGICFMIKK